MDPRMPRPGPQSRERDQRATFLAVLLALFFGGGFLVFLVIITFNIFLGVIAVAAGIAAFVGLHYLLWGRKEGRNSAEPGEKV